MPAKDHTQPINQADADARKAFRELLKRDGAAVLAHCLRVNPRTIERIGVGRDVPPGMARELLDYLIPAPMPVKVDEDTDRWAGAFHRWAKDCRQRMEAANG